MYGGKWLPRGYPELNRHAEVQESARPADAGLFRVLKPRLPLAAASLGERGTGLKRHAAPLKNRLAPRHGGGRKSEDNETTCPRHSNVHDAFRLGIGSTFPRIEQCRCVTSGRPIRRDDDNDRIELLALGFMDGAPMHVGFVASSQCTRPCAIRRIAEETGYRLALGSGPAGPLVSISRRTTPPAFSTSATTPRRWNGIDQAA